MANLVCCQSFCGGAAFGIICAFSWPRAERLIEKDGGGLGEVLAGWRVRKGKMGWEMISEKDETFPHLHTNKGGTDETRRQQIPRGTRTI